MTADQQIKEILSIISPSSESGSDHEWDLIIDFVKQHPGENLAELIYGYAPADVDPWRVGAFFDSLVWAPYSDNGGLLMETLARWLLGNDPRKIEYALAIEGVFPFKEKADMEEAFSRIKLQWPEFAVRCDEILAQRKHR